MESHAVVLALTEEQIPLLSPSPSSSLHHEDEIQPLPHALPPTGREPPKPSTAPDHDRRLASLDVFRGITVALMILVDDAGGAFPEINHSPWMGVTIADFVMPFFLFGVGVSVALVFKEASKKVDATKKAVVRTIKLFLLGVMLQGGYFHGRGNLIYGVDLDHIRWLGVLQRIAIGYIFAAISEIWLVNDMLVDSVAAFVRKFCIQWMVAAVLVATYASLLYGLYVPSWKFEISMYGAEYETVPCEVRGSITPSCNAAGLIDRFLLGSKHLYQHPVYRRTKECCVNSPDYGPLPSDAPGWCLAPFDPEGILSSVMASVTCFVGLHFGHLMTQIKSHWKLIHLWTSTSFLLLIFGYIFKAVGIPFIKPLYTFSYMLLTSGVSGLLLVVIYYIVDVQRIRRPTILFQWMGMNALIVFALAACELFPAALQGLYWQTPENNLVNVMETTLQTIFHSKRWGTMAFVLLEILFWCIVSGFLHKKGIYIKL